MKLARHDRSLIAWTLYACVLFNLFACGLHHGQNVGLQLSGLGGQFCSMSGDSAPAGDDFAGSATSSQLAVFSCPLGAAVTLSIGLLFALSWLLRIGRPQRHPREIRSKAPPRYSWPSANPRASPLA